MIPIIRASVIIRPFAIWDVYPFFIAIPEIIVPIAFNKKNPGIVIIFIIKGPIMGISAIIEPKPANNCVKTPKAKVTNKINFLSIPK